MMNDRELLEWAARAIGKKINDHADQDGKFRFVEDGVASWGPGYWNPLDDDGDALRLAAALRLDISMSCDCCQVYWWAPDMTLNRVNEKTEHYKLAIVRSAAEIGKSMEGE